MEAFQNSANEYIQKARDSQALNTAFTIKPKYWTNSGEKPSYYERKPYIQQKNSDTPSYGSNGNVVHNSNPKTLQFVENDNGLATLGEFRNDGSVKLSQEDSDEEVKTKTDDFNDNLTELGNLAIDRERNSLMNFTTETHQPLKPMVKMNPSTMGANRKLYVPGEKKSPR